MTEGMVTSPSFQTDPINGTMGKKTCSNFTAKERDMKLARTLFQGIQREHSSLCYYCLSAAIPTEGSLAIASMGLERICCRQSSGGNFKADFWMTTFTCSYQGSSFLLYISGECDRINRLAFHGSRAPGCFQKDTVKICIGATVQDEIAR